MSLDTGYHAPIVLADYRARRVRAGRCARDVLGARPRPLETRDEYMQRVEELLYPPLRSFRHQTALALAIYVCAPLACIGLAAAIYLHFYS